MSDKQDYLGVCNEFGVPTQDFELQHCARCFQHECGRSLHGKSQFEQRVGTWEQRLFTEVPEMAEDDPRIDQIRAKKFVEFDAGPVPEVGRSEWVDPRDLEDRPAPEVPAPEPPPEVPKVDEPAPEAQIQERAPVVSAPMNTPNRPGQMVGGREKPQKPVEKDPWEPKKAPTTEGDAQIVKPGARIRFGGSGV